MIVRPGGGWRECHSALRLCSRVATDKLPSSRLRRPSAAPNETGPAYPDCGEERRAREKQSWDPQWDGIVEQALSPEMLSPRVARGVRSYCPRFAAMSEADKRAFLGVYLPGACRAEAGLKPTPMSAIQNPK